MNNLDKTYISLLQDILDNGVTKSDRTGTGTISVFGRQIRHKMSEGFPLLTTKKLHFKSIVVELLWFLRGDTNIKFLVDNNCHIWDGDAHKRFILAMSEGEYQEPTEDARKRFIDKIKTDDEFAETWGELGPVYGKQWRSWHTGWDVVEDKSREAGVRRIEYGIDQIANSINLLKTDPDSRRNRVNAWNVGELDQMVLPPCHTDFQFYTRELTYEERRKLFEEKTNRDSTYILSVRETLDKFQIPTRAISLMWNQRSVDTFLGLPFNIASYGLLLEIIAKEVNMVPDELIGNLGDVHLYSNHIEQAKEQIGRELTHRERIEKLFETNKDAKSLLSQEEPEVISSLLLDELKIPTRTREPYPLPTITLPSSLQPNSGNWDKLVFEDFYLNDYQSHPTIKAPLSN
jgi:thymidylate synthase